MNERQMGAALWISVKERYPAKNTKVLVWFGNEAEPYLDVWRYDGENGYFSPKPSIHMLPHQCVTHWQPLPEPPTD